MAMHHAVRRFDLTWFFNPHYKEDERRKLINFLTSRCKNWVFQIEEAPTTKKLHFQGRIMLKDKMRVTTIAEAAMACDINAHWSETNCKTGKRTSIML